MIRLFFIKNKLKDNKIIKNEQDNARTTEPMIHKLDLIILGYKDNFIFPESPSFGQLLPLKSYHLPVPPWMQFHWKETYYPNNNCNT